MPDTENPYYGGAHLAGSYGRATDTALRRAMKRRREALQGNVNLLAGGGGTSDQLLRLIKESGQAGMESEADLLAGMSLEHAGAIHASEEAAAQRQFQEQLQKDLLLAQQNWQEKMMEKEWGREDTLGELAKKEQKKKAWWKIGLGVLGAGLGTLVAPGIGTAIGAGLGTGAGDIFG